MQSLRDDLQLIVQTQLTATEYVCEGFTGLPILCPGFVAIVAADSMSALASAEALRLEIGRIVQSTLGGVAQKAMPCGGRSSTPFGCHAHRVASCQKVLVIVGDSITSIPEDEVIKKWLAGDKTYHVLPLFPVGGDPSSLLPARLRKINAGVWSKSLVEIVPRVLSLVGLLPEDFRIFISYRRKETRRLADQLFDKLAEERFDVFLDRFRVPPGVNFQKHLTEELAHKSMVVVIESATILKSDWIRYEINAAKTLRLGLLALHAPGGVQVPGVDDAQRIRVSRRDFTSRVLKQDALTRVVQAIKVAHSAALIRRRRSIRKAMRKALLKFGVTGQVVGPEGIMMARSPAPPSKHYSLHLTTRPPDLGDFHVTHRTCSAPPSSTGIIVGPSAFLGNPLYGQLTWLGNVSSIKWFDEGQMVHVAEAIAKGTL